LHVGAMTRQRDLQVSHTVTEALPLLQAALAHVGHRQTRNRGTLGGSLCHLDPSAELVTAAVALEAVLIAESQAGTRRVPVAEWSKGFLTNALQPGELLASVEFPLWPKGHAYGFCEYARRRGDFAIVGVATLFALDSAGLVARAVVAVGGCGAIAQRLPAVEQMLTGRLPDAGTFKEAAKLAADIEAMSDPLVTADYRRHLARVLTERALIAALTRAQPGATACQTH